MIVRRLMLITSRSWKWSIIVFWEITRVQSKSLLLCMISCLPAIILERDSWLLRCCTIDWGVCSSREESSAEISTSRRCQQKYNFSTQLCIPSQTLNQVLNFVLGWSPRGFLINMEVCWWWNIAIKISQLKKIQIKNSEIQLRLIQLKKQKLSNCEIFENEKTTSSIFCGYLFGGYIVDTNTNGFREVVKLSSGGKSKF